MAYFLGKVSTLDTDAGTEQHTVEMPNVLRAFPAWVSGAALSASAYLVMHAER